MQCMQCIICTFATTTANSQQRRPVTQLILAPISSSPLPSHPLKVGALKVAQVPLNPSRGFYNAPLQKDMIHYRTALLKTLVFRCTLCNTSNLKPQWRRHGGKRGQLPPTLSGVDFEINANSVRKLVRQGGGVAMMDK